MNAPSRSPHDSSLSDRLPYLDPAAAPQGTDAEASGRTTPGETPRAARHDPKVRRPDHSGLPPTQDPESHHEGLLAGSIAVLALAGVIAGWISAAGT